MNNRLEPERRLVMRILLWGVGLVVIGGVIALPIYRRQAAREELRVREREMRIAVHASTLAILEQLSADEPDPARKKRLEEVVAGVKRLGEYLRDPGE